MDESLDHLAKDLDGVSAEIDERFTRLSAEEINWKPSAESWSIGQCLEHLLTANKGLIGCIEGKLNGTSPTTLFERLPLLPGFFGRIIGNAVSPEGQRKIKAPKIFEPSTSDVSPSIVADFLGFQPKILSVMEQCSDVRVIMASPAAAFITYSLLDAFRIVVRHEQRHLLQAKRVREQNLTALGETINYDPHEKETISSIL